MVGQAIEQCGGHLGVVKHAWPFSKGEVVTMIEVRS
jgi:hypothetical protein